jgi:LysR family transcriptional regulator, glycine cleavage system transcriptional activator
MEKRLPPLNGLRAFEAAARNLSLKLAADELCVTPAAVSQLVKGLESYLGVALFTRANRGIHLTQAGVEYLPAIRNAFKQIGDATRRIAKIAASGSLTISVTPSFASYWLIPRLQSFHDRHPEIDLRLMTGKEPVDFTRDVMDVAIRHSTGQDGRYYCERLCAVDLIPVASPTLIARLGMPKTASDLTRWPLLHEVGRMNWHLWFQSQSVQGMSLLSGAAFDDCGMMLTAIIAGQGAGLVPAGVAAPALGDNRLVKLWDFAWTEDFAYHLVLPGGEYGPLVGAFREWIIEEFSAHREQQRLQADASGVCS